MTSLIPESLNIQTGTFNASFIKRPGLNQSFRSLFRLHYFNNIHIEIKFCVLLIAIINYFCNSLKSEHAKVL